MQRTPVLPLTLLGALLAAPALTAQDAPPPPSPQVERLAKLAGTWTGEGVWRETADSEAMPWTAQMKITPILGGYFVREDTQIEVGMPSKLAWTSIYGWDADKEMLFAMSVGNNGTGMMRVDMQWADSDTLVGSAAGRFQGELVVGRSTWNIHEKRISYSHEKAASTGEWFAEVEGSWERAESEATMPPAGAFMSMPAPAEMGQLSRMTGTWKLKGEMTFPDGETTVPVTGVEKIEPVFGGHVLAGDAKSDPMPDGHVWHGLSFITWDPEHKRYRSFMADNTGDSSYTPFWWQGDDALVSVEARVVMGEPATMRTVMHFDDAGMTGFDTWMAASTRPAFRSFHATYERAGAR